MKILAIGDDCRMFSGIANQTRKILSGLHKTGWEAVQIGFANQPRSTTPVYEEGIKIYPCTSQEGYNDPWTFRDIFEKEKPDILWLFNDPRFYTWLFDIDNEYRPHTRVVYWHLWDNYPFPKFNLKWYKCVDHIVAISELTHKMLNENGVPCEYIPHALSGKEFVRFSATKRQKLRKEFLARTGFPDTEFLIFSNNRNLNRKRLPDTILAYKRLHKLHPKSLLYLHTDIIDRNGVDLQRFIHEVEPGLEIVLFDQGQISNEALLNAYNISDVYVTIPYNEGFGLSVSEALLCEVPVISVGTGGITPQMTDGNNIFGKLLPVTAKTLCGIVTDPYIYQDYCSVDDLTSALAYCYEHRKDPIYRELGKMGRAHVLKNFGEFEIVQKWVTFLNKVGKEPISYKKHELIRL